MIEDVEKLKALIAKVESEANLVGISKFSYFLEGDDMLDYIAAMEALVDYIQACLDDKIKDSE